MPAHNPIAFARSCGGKVTVRMDSVPGSNNAAPTPCRTRNPISWLLDCDIPHPSEASVKMVRPVRNMRLRPYRSPRIPPVSSRDPSAST